MLGIYGIIGGLKMNCNKKFKILVTEAVGELGLEILRGAPDVELIEKVGISKDEIKRELADVNGILTRSGTTMDQEMIDCAPAMKVIARAGVGVDNINIPAASRKGIIVINAPSGNTLAATELTMASMLSVVRHVPQAYASLKNGEWKRSKFTGVQLNGKRLLIIGLGRIGSAVAVRCRAFGMDVIAYDPYITQKKADSVRVQLVNDLEGALSVADMVTIHTPLTSETRNMINSDTLRAFKKGAFLINCARGGIVEEAAVADAIREGRLSGFGTDVYTAEPLCREHPFLADDIADKIVLTPHIGANTAEAQSEVSRIAAENMLAALRGEPYAHAVNLPFMEQALTDKQKNYLNLSRKMGILAANLAKVRGAAVHNTHVTLRGTLFDDDELVKSNRLRPYTVAMLKGLLEVSLGQEISYMLAPLLAKDRHVSIDESAGEPQTYKNTIEVKLETEKGELGLIGTITEEGRQRIVNINGYWVDFVPGGKLLIFQNHDRPGVIGKIGNLLGEASVNIANFALGRKEGSGLALGVLEIDGKIDAELHDKLVKNGDMIWVSTVDFSEEC